jgi:hypothetical protein
MTLTEDEKHFILNALRKVKVEHVGGLLGMKPISYHPKHVTFVNNDHDSTNGSSPEEADLPHWLIDKIHAGIK